MLAAVLESPGSFVMHRQVVESLAPRQVRIQVEGCGICASSVPVWEGRSWFNYPLAPGAPGHEGWGVVEDIGSEVTSLRKGDRVAFLSEHA